MNLESTKFKRITLIIILISGVILYSVFNPSISKFFPQCPFFRLTGYQCPGCGSQRAIYCLLHLEFKKAFYFNPLFILSIPYLLLGIYFEYFGGKQRYPNIRRKLFGQKAIIIIIIIIISFWIGRNIWLQ